MCVWGGGLAVLLIGKDLRRSYSICGKNLSYELQFLARNNNTAPSTEDFSSETFSLKTAWTGPCRVQ